ncbi:MAG: efflux RND transporter periplasmic adaptor subunit [Lachnospiraceae bacterium]|nr:efflux RND transporter periplasmic adaptor subunit [Lachnospiraceae bacterium]
MGQELEVRKKKKWVLPVVIVVVLAVIGGGVFAALRFFKVADPESSDGEVVYDDAGMYDVGTSNYYAGIVEAQETQEVQKDSSKEIAEIYVEVGDEVKKGDALFAYKTDELKLEIDKAKLSLESSATSITEYNNQIASYNQKISETSDNDTKAKYQMQITEIQNNIRQAQLEQRTTQAEIAAKQKSIENAVVKSTVDGVVKTISMSSTDSGPYMTILGTGTYRIKGSVDEMNVGMLNEGMSVVVHSRVDQSKTWNGKITKIDTESINKDSSNQEMYSEGASGGESATKYSFYVELENVDGLLLGQHVYVEPIFDSGDTEMTEEAPAEDAETTETEETEETEAVEEKTEE